ncbi:MAG: hypothetical protein R2843_10815 [Thermomicrobiales bacterium]
MRFTIGEITDVRRQPDQFVADAEFLDQRRDFAIALKQMVVEVFGDAPPATSNAAA